ncbi:MAG TPA: hypothetical protein VHW00_20675 [Thermoanaerobaculia bacterium]|nr:hypothetical protein [Thermoanaerobaculia bacterium]
MTEARKKEWVALAILAALPTLLFADVLLGFNVLHTRDVFTYHYPLRHVLREIVLGGEFPYWNPFIAAGQPLAANPAHEIFYPLTWLILLPNFSLGFHLHALVHVYIATFGMYTLLRSMQTGRTASVLAALSFGLGGLLTSQLNLFPFLFSTAWIPWICLYARRALRDGTRRDFAIAALFLSLQLLVAEPTTTLQTGALLGLYAIFHGRGTVARKLGVVAALCLVATLIAAVQIIPTFDHFRDSVRSRGIPFEMVEKWSLPPVRVAELLNPQLLGEPDPIALNEYWGGGVYRGSFKPFFYSIYSGLLIVIGVIAGLATRKRGSALYLTIAAISLIASIGAHTPLLRIAYDAGIASAIRYTEKFLIIGIFASIVFAGRALDDVLRGDARARRAALLAAIGVVAISSTLALTGSTSLWEPLFRRVWLVPDGFDIRAMLPVAQKTWVFAAARAIALLLILFASTRMRPALWRLLLALFVVADVGSLVPRLAPRADRSFYDEPSFARALPKNRGEYRVYHYGDDAAPAGASDPYFRPQPEGEWLRRNTLTPYSPATHDFQLVLHNDFDLTTLTPSEDFRAAMAELRVNGGAWLQPAITMSNVHYAIVYRDGEQAFAAANGNPRAVQPVEFRFTGPNPRYWFARQLITIEDRHDFAARLQRQRYVPGMTFIEAPAFTPAPARIVRVRETTQSARLDVEALGPAFLVISVTPHKYWRLTIDGNETDAVRTNVGYQGVLVPPGKHVVEMRYANPLIAASGAISLASLLGLFLFVRRRAIDGAGAEGSASNA